MLGHTSFCACMGVVRQACCPRKPLWPWPTDVRRTEPRTHTWAWPATRPRRVIPMSRQSWPHEEEHGSPRYDYTVMTWMTTPLTALCVDQYSARPRAMQPFEERSEDVEDVVRYIYIHNLWQSASWSLGIALPNVLLSGSEFFPLHISESLMLCAFRLRLNEQGHAYSCFAVC